MIIVPINLFIGKLRGNGIYPLTISFENLHLPTFPLARYFDRRMLTRPAEQRTYRLLLAVRFRAELYKVMLFRCALHF